MSQDRFLQEGTPVVQTSCSLDAMFVPHMHASTALDLTVRSTVSPHAQQSQHQAVAHIYGRGDLGVPHVCVSGWYFCFTLVTQQLLCCLFVQLWLLLPSLSLGHRWRGCQPAFQGLWHWKWPPPQQADPLCLFVPLQLPVAPPSSGPPLAPLSTTVIGCSTVGQPSLYAVKHFISSITLPPKPSCACV